MIADGNLLFSNAQTYAATADSTNVLDFGVAEDLGITERPLEIFIDHLNVPVGSSPGTTTIQTTLLTSSDNTNFTLLATGPVVLTTAFTAGAKWVMDIPPGCKRYVKMNYAVASGSLTTAAMVTSGIVLNSDGGQKYYPRAYQA